MMYWTEDCKDKPIFEDSEEALAYAAKCDKNGGSCLIEKVLMRLCEDFIAYLNDDKIENYYITDGMGDVVGESYDDLEEAEESARKYATKSGEASLFALYQSGRRRKISLFMREDNTIVEYK